MHLRAYLRLLVGDRRTSTFLYLSLIWSAVSLVGIFFDIYGKYSLVFIAGMFAGMAFLSPWTRGAGMKVKQEKSIVP